MTKEKEALRISNGGKVEGLTTRTDWKSPTGQSVSLCVISDDEEVLLNVKLVGSDDFVELPFFPRQWMEYLIMEIKGIDTDTIYWGAGKSE